MTTYIYPQNLKATVKFWLWSVKDFIIIALALIVSVFIATTFITLIPFAVIACYAFLTIRFEDSSVIDYIRYATGFFISSQQSFFWSERLSRERK